MKTIFVSSTFRDMQLERDALQSRVLPLLNAEAEKYGQTVSFCDLRWGVNTSELESDAGSRKVLDVCLDEIDRCQRPMIVVLGERYGWIPSGTLIRDAAERKKMQLESLRISVTALEIEYGALGSDTDLNNTLFYFRNVEGDVPEDYLPEDPEHEELIRRLKDRILHLTGGRIKTYTLHLKDGSADGIQDFCSMVAQDVSNMLRPEWEAYEQLTDKERERLKHESFVREKSALFRARKGLRDSLTENLLTEEPLLVIKGDAGSGKSTLLAAIASKLKEQGADVIPFISCLTLNSSTALDLVKSMCLELEQRLAFAVPEEAPENEKGWMAYLEELCREMNASEHPPVFFLIDAADQLFPDDLRNELAFVPKTLGKNVRMAVTCMTDLSAGIHPFEKLLPADRKEQEEIIAGMLESRRRELDRSVTQKLLEKSAADNPLYLTLLITRLLMMDRSDFSAIMQSGDGMDAITKRQCQIVEEAPEELDQLAAAVFRVAAERINPELIGAVSSLLAISRGGLRTEDLTRALPESFNTLDFIHFVHYMSDSFLQREDGRFDFTHKSMRAGLLAGCGDQALLHRQLAAAFYEAPAEDPLRRTELIYHLLRGKESRDFLTFLTENIDPAAEDARSVPEQTKGLLKNAADRVYEFCRDDGEPDYLRILEDADHSGMERERAALVRFNILYLYQAFPSGARVNRILGRILQKNMELLRHTDAVSPRTWFSAWRSLGKTIRYSSESEKANEAARKCYEKARQYLEEIPDTERNAMDIRRMARLWYDSGEAFETNETVVSRNDNAFDCFQKAEALYREAAKDEAARYDMESSRAQCFIRMGDACSNTTGTYDSVERQALSCYEKAREIQKELLSQKDSANMRRKLIRSGKSLAYRRLESAGPDNNRIAYRLLEENVEMARRIYADQKELRNLQLLSDCLGDLYHAYATSLEWPHRLRALVLMAEQLPIAMRIAKDDGSYYSAAACLRSAAAVLTQAGGPRNLRWALDFLNAADDILQKNQLLPFRSDPNSFQYWKLRGAILSGLGAKDEADACYAISGKWLASHTGKRQDYAYAELLDIMDYLGKEYQYKVSTKLLDIFETYASTDYIRHIDPSIPLEEQEIDEKTRALLASLLVSFWSENEEEQISLMETYRKNEEKLQEESAASRDREESTVDFTFEEAEDQPSSADHVNDDITENDLTAFFSEAGLSDGEKEEHFPVRPVYPPSYLNPFRQELSMKDNLAAGRYYSHDPEFECRFHYASLYLCRAAAMGSAEACGEMEALNREWLADPDEHDLGHWNSIMLQLQLEEAAGSDTVYAELNKSITEPFGYQKAPVRDNEVRQSAVSALVTPAAEDLITAWLDSPASRDSVYLADLGKKALDGDPAAQCELAGLYAKGEAPFKGPEKELAVDYWKAAIQQNYMEAKYSYADFCLLETNKELTDGSNGESMLLELAENGYTKAMIRLGQFYSRYKKHRNIPEAVNWLQKAAQKESAEALYELGLLYYRDASGEYQDEDLCIRYLTEASDRGNVDAMNSLGKLMLKKQDFRQALPLLEKAMKGKNGEAAYWAGRIYEDDAYGIKDVFNARLCYSLGALQNNRDCIQKAFQIHFSQNATQYNNLMALRMEEKLFAMEPTKERARNLRIFYHGYERLPHNSERTTHYRLLEEFWDTGRMNLPTARLESMDYILKHNSRDLRYFLKEIPAERTDFDALTAQSYSFGTLTFKIPCSYHAIRTPLTKKREIRPDCMEFQNGPDNDGRFIRLFISQGEAHCSDLREYTGTWNALPQGYKGGILLQELNGSGLPLTQVEPTDQANVLIAGELPAVLSEFNAEILCPDADGDERRVWGEGRSLYALIDGPDREHPYQLHIVMVYGSDMMSRLEHLHDEFPWSSNDDFICICDAIRKK